MPAPLHTSGPSPLGVIRGRSIGADRVDHDAELVDQILAPGRGVARARRHLREQARDGPDGSIIVIRDKASRIDVRTFSDGADISGMLRIEALPPVGRMRRIDRGAAGADDIFRLGRDFRTVMGRVFERGR